MSYNFVADSTVFTQYSCIHVV